MVIVVHLLIGALVCAAFIYAVRRLAPRSELQIYAAGLVAAALIYVVFAVERGASGAWVGVEFAGLLAFTALALPGLKRSALPLALGWGAHALWDLLLHADALTHASAATANPHFVPDWYRLVCAGFDFALAAYLAARLRPTNAPARVR